MILCCGEALIDMLPRITAQGEMAFAPHPGGGIFTTARALGRLGVPAGLVCGLSRDLFGALLVQALTDAGVDTALAPRSDRPTTLAFVTLTGGQARYAFYDEGTAARMLAPADLPDLPDAVQAMVFGGISLIAEPCGVAFQALMTRAAARTPRPLLMIDPNIRPGFIRDEPAYRARLAQMFALADIVKLSDDDLAWLAPPGGTLGLGARWVLLTQGAEGAVLHGAPGGPLHVPAPRVQVADTVGAGDTVNAGFLSGLHTLGALSPAGLDGLCRDDLTRCLAHAMAAAAVTVTRPGANPPWARDLPPV